MAPRTRTKYIPTPKGRVVTGGNLAAGGFYDTLEGIQSVSDHTGPGDNDPFSVYKLKIEGGRVNVFNSPGNFWENYRVDYLDVESFGHLGSLQDRTDSDYATETAAKTNPSRPYVDIPVNILELSELPDLIRRQGLNTIASLGRQNLRYQFGIAPLVGDLIRLASFQDVVQHRIGELERLQGKTGLRRTVRLNAWTEQTSYSRVMQSNQFFWTDTVTQTTMQLVKGHARWIPDATGREMTASDRQRLAFRAALGLTFDSATVWERIPWSWLVDWCTSTGQWFIANRNIVGATLADISVMRETKSWFQTPGNINTPINVQMHTKARNRATVLPQAHFPFLTAGQMSILASLAVTRRR